MKARCPYCGGQMTGEAAYPQMRARTLRVYKTLVAAGHGGIKTSDLLVRMYADDEWPTPGGNTVLRVQVHELNKILAKHDQKVVWRGNAGRKEGSYRLISTKEE